MPSKRYWRKQASPSNESMAYNTKCRWRVCFNLMAAGFWIYLRYQSCARCWSSARRNTSWVSVLKMMRCRRSRWLSRVSLRSRNTLGTHHFKIQERRWMLWRRIRWRLGTSPSKKSETWNFQISMLHEMGDWTAQEISTFQEWTAHRDKNYKMYISRCRRLQRHRKPRSPQNVK